jgi:hypothetical protein
MTIGPVVVVACMVASAASMVVAGGRGMVVEATASIVDVALMVD